MAIITSQQIKSFHERFGNKEITFNRNIVKALSLAREYVLIKFQNEQYHCTIISSSMQEAKIILELPNAETRREWQKDKLASLRFSFHKEEGTDILSFFVQSRINSITAYNKEKNLFFVHLIFTQQPPDNLIEILGKYIELNFNESRRKEERIPINDANMRRMGIASKSVPVLIDRVPRNGILRDLSFSGMNVIVLGNAKFLIEKSASISLPMKDGSTIPLEGKIIRHEPVEDRRDLVVIAIQYNTSAVPFEYKKMINENLSRKDTI